MRFQVLLSWGVTSCLCIDKIPEAAKTKVSKAKEIFFIKEYTPPPPPPKKNGSFKHAPTCLRHCVGRFAKHHPNVYAMKEGGAIILAVVLLLPPAPCLETLCFIMKANLLCLCF